MGGIYAGGKMSYRKQDAVEYRNFEDDQRRQGGSQRFDAADCETTSAQRGRPDFTDSSRIEGSRILTQVNIHG
jgi:hypothetical protein